MKMRSIAKFLALGFLMAAASPVLPAAEEKPKAGLEEAPLVGGLKDLKRLNRNLVGMAANSAEATVSLMSRGGGGAGSGVIVSEDGLILTAAHVLAALNDEIVVIFPDGSRKQAKPLGADFDRDAAMVQITEEGKYPFVELGKSDGLKRNQWCVALGHPGGFDPMRTPPVRLGRILRVGEFVVTDCAVVGGDSGGPLFDVKGRLLGIHSNIGATLSENRHVPIDVYRDQWDKMKAGDRIGKRFAGNGAQDMDPNRAVMGVQLGEPSNDGGVLVDGVIEGSPAAEVGLKEGDVIVSVNGKKVAERERLIELVGRLSPGKTAKIAYRREGEVLKVDVKLISLKDMIELMEGLEGQPGEKEEEEKPKEENGDEDGKDALDRYLDKAIDGNSGAIRLELTPEQLKEFGGMEEIQKRIRERLEGKEPEPKKEEPQEEEPKEEENAADADKPGNEEQDLADTLREMLDDALNGKGQLEMTPEMIEELGGIEELAKGLEEMAKRMGPEEMEKMMEQMGQMAGFGPDTFFESSMKALKPVVAKAKASTVVVTVDGKAAILGTVVADNGLVLTKDTETRKGAIGVRLGEEDLRTTVLKRFPKRDLALLKVESDQLRPVNWAQAKRRLPIGALLTAAGVGEDPLGIGVVSVQTRALAEVGFLGIQTAEGEGGVLIEQVVKGSAAEESGLKKGDVILSIDGQDAGLPHEFGTKVRGRKAGEQIKLEVRTGEETRTLEVKLKARAQRPEAHRNQQMNLMSGPLSSRVSGFPEALQHDIPLRPEMCGGPLLDLNGRCVGINVSRAGRVKTLAIPASDVQGLLGEVDGAALLAAAKEEAARKEQAVLNAKEREKIRKVISEMRKELEGLEKLLEEMEKK